jgi:orotate phosphoribosyltransferase
MTEGEALAILKRKNAIRTEGHYVYASWDHGNAYVDKDPILQDPHTAFQVTQGIAELLAPHAPDVIVGPELGGIGIAMFVACHLTELCGRTVNAAFAEKIGEEAPFQYRLRSGHDLVVKNKRAAIVEDIINTGHTVERVINAVRPHASEIVAIGAICDRSIEGHRYIAGVSPVCALINIRLKTHDWRGCPFCKRGDAVCTDLGYGEAFLKRQARANSHKL